MSKGRATSIFLQATNPLRGIWVAPRVYSGINRSQRWTVSDGTLKWEPAPPPDAHLREPTIEKLIALAAKHESVGGSPFLKLSGTTKTGITWSLPPVAACPIIDETCGGCYALDGWYRTNLSAQYGRVKRQEYLQLLIREGRLSEWVDWISNQINRIRPVEAFPSHVVDPNLKNLLASTGIDGAVAYFRWHDSGDLFHADYAKAVFQVCEQTPRVFHWMPTRMGPLVSWLTRQGVGIPSNLAIQVSTHRGGKNEASQLAAVEEINQNQPRARVGLTYVFSGPASRKVDMTAFRKEFGTTANLCPATVAEKSEDRVCNGCRRCWAHASIKSPIIYAVHHGN
jgi:hypothetical protein